MGRRKIQNGWVEYFSNNYQLHWQGTIKVGFAVKDPNAIKRETVD